MMRHRMDEEGLDRLRRERDLYRSLLELDACDDVRPLLERSLSLVVEASGAEQGYVELYPDAEIARRSEKASEKAKGGGEVDRFSFAHGVSSEELAHVRRSLSSGIVAEALATGRTIATASAVDDPRFSGFASVQAGRIRAVLCAPIALSTKEGLGASLGAIYLSGRKKVGPFDPEDRARLEIVARHLAPLADRLITRETARPRVDHTEPLRAKLPPSAAAIAGRSLAIADVLRQVLVAAPVPVTVLVRGESGTGKTAVARVLHDASPRAAGPFVEVNAGAIPETLFESELFGAEKGAHSTATARAIGKIEAAAGGTLFLDEVAEIPLGSQAKLLTFLQNRTFHRLGGATPVVADVRVVVATHQDLEALVKAKRFREDLYYRLAVLEVAIPPLRARREDIDLVAEAVAGRLGDDPAARLPLARAATLSLGESEWPGNVRQLENVIARGWARALAEGSSTIEPRHLFEVAAAPPTSSDARAPGSSPASETVPYHEAVRRAQGRIVAEALDACGWNVSETARRLDVSRSHLNDLIRAHGLVRARASKP
jgi:Nif-specific regulatory protein